MSIDNDAFGDIVFKCDTVGGEHCEKTLDTGTRSFKEAMVVFRTHRWWVEKVDNLTWKHKCEWCFRWYKDFKK